MQICYATRFVRIAAVLFIAIIIGVPALVSVRAQSTPSTPPAAAPIQLQVHTAEDQSVSFGVPAGWTIKNAGTGQVNLAGPKGEAITFGAVFLAKEGPFQLGQKGPGAALMSMPSSAKLTDKLTMFVEQQEALNGGPAAQVKIAYAAPLQSLPAGVQCAVFVIAVSGIATPIDGMGLFCSLAPDVAQLSKIVLLMGSAPTTIAPQTVPTVAAVYKSYKIAPGWVQKMLSPYTPTASASPTQGAGSAAETEMYLRAMEQNQQVIDHGFTCADAGIIGPSNLRTAAECGYLPSF